jgi:hypothetical protein
MCIEQIQPFIVANIVGGVLTSMDAPITQCQQNLVQPIRVICVGEKVHITRGPHHLMRSQCQPADQRWRGLAADERGHGLLDLFDQSGHAGARCSLSQAGGHGH